MNTETIILPFLEQEILGYLERQHQGFGKQLSKVFDTTTMTHQLLALFEPEIIKLIHKYHLKSVFTLKQRFQGYKLLHQKIEQLVTQQLAA